jgi:hypothetical protein
VELLIAKGADVNARDKEDTTPLFLAAAQSVVNTDKLKLLMAGGADVDARIQHSTNSVDLGMTPLMYAVRYPGNIEAVKLLIAKGADVKAKDNYGKTPLYEVISWATELHQSDKTATAGSKETAELLLAHGADVNAGGMLEKASLQGSTDWAEWLINKGANVNGNVQSTHSGYTPLYNAVHTCDAEMVKLLIAKGADANIEVDHNALLWGLDNNILTIGHPCPEADRQTIRANLQVGMAKSMGDKAGNDIPKLLAKFKGHSDDEILRAAIIRVALEQHLAATIPPEAEAAAGRGAYIFKNAKSPDEILSAAKEYLAAIEMAPWVANYYYNLCTVLEKTPYTQQALHACKLYLVAAPDASDAGDMRQRIAGLQYAADRDKAQMQQRTTGIKNRGLDGLYRLGGISEAVSGNDIAMKLVVDWYEAPPKYQIYVGCFVGNNEIMGDTHDLVSTDTWEQMCEPNVNLHLLIKPEGEGFVQLSDASGGGIRTTLDELFKAKQKTMAQWLVSSSSDGQGERHFYVGYKQGGNDNKHAGYAMFECDCNGNLLKQDPRALPDDFLSFEEVKADPYSRFLPEVMDGNPTTCKNQFFSKTGYHFGESE